MREIKFRAWNNEDKIMNTQYTCNLLIHFIGEINSFDKDGMIVGTEYTKKLELMQYTGLKDIYGIEIYEGDIVNAIYFKNKWIGKIIFNDNMACFELYVKHEDGHINSYLIGDMNSIEVIGNIYENPELLQN